MTCVGKKQKIFFWRQSRGLKWLQPAIQSFYSDAPQPNVHRLRLSPETSNAEFDGQLGPILRPSFGRDSGDNWDLTFFG